MIVIAKLISIVKTQDVDLDGEVSEKVEFSFQESFHHIHQSQTSTTSALAPKELPFSSH